MTTSFPTPDSPGFDKWLENLLRSAKRKGGPLKGRGHRPVWRRKPFRYSPDIRNLIDVSEFDRDNLGQNIWNPLSFKHLFPNMNNLGLVTDSYRTHQMTKFLLERNETSGNLYCKSGTLICVGRFDFAEWIDKNFDSYTMVTKDNALATKKFDGKSLRCEFFVKSNNLTYECHGLRTTVLEFSAWLGTQGFLEDEIYIRWAYGKSYQDMDSFDLPLMTLPRLKTAYPWIEKGISEYAQEFMRSRESVLLMIGDPGTGKTTLLKEIIKEMNSNALITYDTELLLTDGFFASFISRDDTHVLIIEDADALLSSRKDGNTMMHRFLNASDGLVSLRHKKIIFTTNLPSVNSVDPALLRAGRCFDVMKFRKLTKVEALAVAEEMKLNPMPELTKESYSLAEITNWNKTNRLHGEEAVLPKVGFKVGFGT